MKKILKLKPVTREIEREIKSVLDKINEKDTNKFINLLSRAGRIFLTGQGRSGLVADAFAMRLMQLGLKTYAVGDPTTPSIKVGDLLVAISGSGKTKITEDIINEAKKSKANVCLLTANRNTPMARKSDLVIEIDAKTKLNHRKSIEPLGSLFEQCAFLYLDSIILLLMGRLRKKEKSLKRRHATLE